MVDYVRALFAYSVRSYFPNEVGVARDQTYTYVSSAFTFPELKWTYAFFLTGWALGLLFGGRSIRKVALLCIITFAVFIAGAAIYLFSGVDWRATMPLYCET